MNEHRKYAFRAISGFVLQGRTAAAVEGRAGFEYLCERKVSERWGEIVEPRFSIRLHLIGRYRWG